MTILHILIGGFDMNKRKLGNFLAIFSLVIATVSANVSCYWWFNQPEFPENAKKLRKF